MLARMQRKDKGNRECREEHSTLWMGKEGLSEKLTFEQKHRRSQSDTPKHLGEESEGTIAVVQTLRWNCALYFLRKSKKASPFGA